MEVRLGIRSAEYLQEPEVLQMRREAEVSAL